MNQQITIKVDQEQANKTLSLIKSAVEKLSELDVDRLRESAHLFLEFLDESIDLNKLLRIDSNIPAGGAGNPLVSLGLTDSAIYLFTALWAIERNGMLVDDAHRKLLVDRLLGNVNPTTGSSSEVAL